MNGRMRTAAVFLVAFHLAWPICRVSAEEPAGQADTVRADRMLAAYFADRTAQLRDACLADVETLDDWTARRDLVRRQLREMLGLQPWPERTDLEATVTGSLESEQFTVEKLHFQSLPKLYVTANLYLPKDVEGRRPAVLYVCGHGRVVQDGVSCGNKTHYRHHGAWFARHGYVCLVIDTIQLGEFPGIHHGTYREGMWWWSNRGYTPAGVEAWNAIRAVDYLQSRDEVDPERIGVTGRSGGGVYSWWATALDDRIKAAVPVAGITDLQNHVVDGCVEGHCDCMFMVNTYGWDYPMLAALAAPRPLLISNTDRDGIFPLDGVVRTYTKVRRLYELHGKGDLVALDVEPGPHKDTQPLRISAFAWLDQHLMGVDRLIDAPAVPFFEPIQLRVFDKLPEDERVTTIHETFVPAAPPPPAPESVADWQAMRDAWFESLRTKTFGGWPETPGPLDLKETFAAANGRLVLHGYELTSQRHVRLPLWVLSRGPLAQVERVELRVLDAAGWAELPTRSESGELDAAAWTEFADRLKSASDAIAFFPPRGIGPTAWSGDTRRRTHVRRRFLLLGQTRDGMRVFDVRRAIQAVRSLAGAKPAAITLVAETNMAGIALYGALFEPPVDRLDLTGLPATHRDGPYLLNVRRYLDMPQAAALAAERGDVTLRDVPIDASAYAQAVAEKLNWPENRLNVIPPAK